MGNFGATALRGAGGAGGAGAPPRATEGVGGASVLAIPGGGSADIATTSLRQRQASNRNYLLQRPAGTGFTMHVLQWPADSTDVGVSICDASVWSKEVLT